MVTVTSEAQQVNIVNQQHSWFTVFLLERENSRCVPEVHCVGCRELVILDYKKPTHIRGVIEFNGAYIPVIDPGILSLGEPTRFSNLSCILIVPHGVENQKLHTGIIIGDIDEIMEFASSEAPKNISVNIGFVLDMRKDCGMEPWLYENHRMLDACRRESLQEKDYIDFEKICSEKALSR
jgi:hypothetical protein